MNTLTDVDAAQYPKISARIDGRNRQALDIEVCADIRELERIEPLWNALGAECGHRHAALTCSWHIAWWRAFGRGRRMHVLLVRDRGVPVAIAPLMLSRERFRGVFPVTVVRFMENDNSPCADFIIPSPENRRAVLERIVDHLEAVRGEWDMVSLANIPVESPNYTPLLAILKEREMLHGTLEGLKSPYIRIQSDWESFFSGRSKKFRKVLRNKVNRMEKAGEFAIQCRRELDPEGTVMAAILAISRKSWKGRHHKDIMKSHENIRFFTELSRVAAEKGWLRIWLLSLNGTAIAYEYHLAYGGRVHALRADYDESFSDISPGSFLDLHVVRATFGEAQQEYDMCGSDDFYKKNWTSDIREHGKVMIFNPGFYGRTMHTFQFKAIAGLKRYAIVQKLALVIREAQ